MNRPPIDDASANGFDWRYLRRQVLAYRRELVAAHAFAVLATLATVPQPLLFPVLVDEVLLGQPGPFVAAIDAVAPPGWRGPALYVLTVLVLTLLLRAVALVLGVLETRQFTRISKGVTYRMRRALLKRLERVSLSEYETLGSGGVTSNFITDLETVDRFLGATSGRFLVSILSLAGIAGVLLWLHWQLALFILLLNPLIAYCTVLLGRRVRELKKQENSAVERFQDALTETLDAIHQIRASNRGAFYVRRLRRKAAKIRERAIHYHWRQDAAGRVSFTIFLFGFDLFRAAAMLMVVFSDLTIGQMVAVFSYLWYLMTPVQQLLNIHYSYYAADGALERVNRLLRLEQEPRTGSRVDPFRGRQTVDLVVEDLHFAYGRGPEVLKGVSLTVRAGERVALVGASGGGKSTLVQALLGLYPPSQGQVRYGGVSVEHIGFEVVRENVATVLQHPALFNDSVRMNLTLGRELPDSDLWQCLELAQLAEVVADLERGLDTVVGRQGVRLSGGQRQRLAIARMLLQDPKVVILDEATSAVDLLTEQRLFAALDQALSGRSLLIIAHRLSSLRFADRVFVFEDGRVAEEGAQDDLLARDGLYAQLYGRILAG